jgi:hypothetical protein
MVHYIFTVGKTHFIEAEQAAEVVANLSDKDVEQSSQKFLSDGKRLECAFNCVHESQ